jgi:hypothetical protein
MSKNEIEEKKRVNNFGGKRKIKFTKELKKNHSKNED